MDGLGLRGRHGTSQDVRPEPLAVEPTPLRDPRRAAPAVLPDTRDPPPRILPFDSTRVHVSPKPRPSLAEVTPMGNLTFEITSMRFDTFNSQTALNRSEEHTSELQS